MKYSQTFNVALSKIGEISMGHLFAPLGIRVYRRNRNNLLKFGTWNYYETQRSKRRYNLLRQ